MARRCFSEVMSFWDLENSKNKHKERWLGAHSFAKTCRSPLLDSLPPTDPKAQEGKVDGRGRVVGPPWNTEALGR
jgi:hypothetical protein